MKKENDLKPMSDWIIIPILALMAVLTWCQNKYNYICCMIKGQPEKYEPVDMLF